jgi:hypothetical protein
VENKKKVMLGERQDEKRRNQQIGEVEMEVWFENFRNENEEVCGIDPKISKNDWEELQEKEIKWI